MERDARGLALDDRSGRPRGDLVELADHLGAAPADLLGERARESGFELASVGADEVDFRGQAAQGGEVAQRAAGDHRDVRVGERRQGTQRDDRLTHGQRLSGVVDVPRNRAVVVAGDQQDRHRDDVVDDRRPSVVVPFGVTRCDRHDSLGRDEVVEEESSPVVDGVLS